jgi:hypothetical protein
MPEPINLADLEGDATKPSQPETLGLGTGPPDSQKKSPGRNRPDKKKNANPQGPNKAVNVEEFFKNHQMDQLAGMLPPQGEPQLGGPEILNKMDQLAGMLPPKKQTPLDQAEIMKMMFTPEENIPPKPFPKPLPQIGTRDPKLEPKKQSKQRSEFTVFDQIEKQMRNLEKKVANKKNAAPAKLEATNLDEIENDAFKKN